MFNGSCAVLFIYGVICRDVHVLMGVGVGVGVAGGGTSTHRAGFIDIASLFTRTLMRRVH